MIRAAFRAERRFWLVLLAGLALPASSAFAQDPIADWSGPYAGAQFAFVLGQDSSVTTNLVGTFPVPFDYMVPGPTIGAHAGYAVQASHFVFGLELDAEFGALSGKQADDLYAVTYRSETTADFDASLRAKAGIAFDNMLLYATAGPALGHTVTAYYCDGCVAAAGATSTLDDIRLGWTVGAGVAYAVTPDMSLSLEYRYTNLGAINYTDVPQVADYHDNRFTAQAVKLGVSFKLH